MSETQKRDLTLDVMVRVITRGICKGEAILMWPAIRTGPHPEEVKCWASQPGIYSDLFPEVMARTKPASNEVAAYTVWRFNRRYPKEVREWLIIRRSAPAHRKHRWKGDS